MRFFDTGSKKQPERVEEPEKPRVRNVIDRESLEAAKKTMREAGFDPDDNPLVKGPDHGVLPVRYTKEIVGNWQIDHGARGNDYMVQLIPRRPIDAGVKQVIAAVITVLSGIIPETVQVYINPPVPHLEIDFYTIRLEGALSRPGAEAVLAKRIPLELGQINVWAT